jgi:endoglucanase
MKPFRLSTLVLAFLFLISQAVFAQPAPEGSPVARYGQLKVVAGNICDSAGKPVALKGMSTMGLQWYGGIVNEAAFVALARDWKIDVIRLALYVAESGYASRPALKALVMKGIDLAIANGIYVIVDWHVLNPGNPNDPVYAGAEAFFTELAGRYGKTPNLIYEIMNEPNGPANWAKDIKPYAVKMTAAIRAVDPDNLILIGSGTWSQDVDEAAADPVPGTNLVYTVHFYAGSHGPSLRNKIQAALDRKVAVFVSEWGTSKANGDGGPFPEMADIWLDFLAARNIGWVNWSLCDKAETSAAFKRGGSSPLAPTAMGHEGYAIWTPDQLSDSGVYVRARLRGETPPSP